MADVGLSGGTFMGGTTLGSAGAQNGSADTRSHAHLSQVRSERDSHSAQANMKTRQTQMERLKLHTGANTPEERSDTQTKWEP